jgi:hypothetical protein
MEDYPDKLLDGAKAVLESSDVMAAAEFLSQEADPVAVMKVYRDLVMQTYWRQKDLPRVMTLALAGIHYGLTYATGKGTDELRYDLRSLAKTLAYNLASFTWPGWEEPGVTIGPAAVAVGLDAARLNLRLAEELNKGDLSLCRGHWMSGAQSLANGLSELARHHFEESDEYARRAESTAEVFLAYGFAALARLREAPGDAEATARLRIALERLAGLDNGKEFRNQILAASRVFGIGIPADLA